MAERSGIAEIILAAREGLAQICLRRGTYAQALQHLRAAVETVESLRARIPTPELRSTFVQQNSRVYEAIVDVLSRLHARDPAAGYDRHAFAFRERGRARGFLDSLAESKASVTKGLTTEQVRRQNQLHAELSKFSAALLREGSESNRRAVDSAERRLAEWALDLRRINRRYHDLQYPKPYDAAKAQTALAAAGAVILEYDLGERQRCDKHPDKAVKAPRVPNAVLPDGQSHACANHVRQQQRPRRRCADSRTHSSSEFD